MPGRRTVQPDRAKAEWDGGGGGDRASERTNPGGEVGVGAPIKAQETDSLAWGLGAEEK